LRNLGSARVGFIVCVQRSIELDIKEHPVMMTEPSFQPCKSIEKAVELLFEKFQPHALFLAKNAVLTSFASGRQTSMVVDMGYEGSIGTLPLDPKLLPLRTAAYVKALTTVMEARHNRGFD